MTILLILVELAASLDSLNTKLHRPIAYDSV
ncbi:hypothetical protein SAMN04515695_5319 [Pseudovibrio sp. Tun.PSC04-5.I4]|nr:hypothetical protein SAMN04515695_5319 [Pseudovibrio sp. Tun.PSC04-5.I4]